MIQLAYMMQRIMRLRYLGILQEILQFISGIIIAVIFTVTYKMMPTVSIRQNLQVKEFRFRFDMLTPSTR